MRAIHRLPSLPALLLTCKDGPNSVAWTALASRSRVLPAKKNHDFNNSDLICSFNTPC